MLKCKKFPCIKICVLGNIRVERGTHIDLYVNTYLVEANDTAMKAHN